MMGTMWLLWCTLAAAATYDVQLPPDQPVEEWAECLALAGLRSGPGGSGVWVEILDRGETWIFVRMERIEVDSLLSRMVRNDIVPGGAVNRLTIFWGVRIGGVSHFGRGDIGKNQPPAGLNHRGPMPRILPV